jgi:hypothetical protein
LSLVGRPLKKLLLNGLSSASWRSSLAAAAVRLADEDAIRAAIPKVDDRADWDKLRGVQPAEKQRRHLGGVTCPTTGTAAVEITARSAPTA